MADHLEEVGTVPISGEVEAKMSAGPKGPMDVLKQTLVVFEPVKRGVGENKVTSLNEVKLIDLHQGELYVTAGFRKSGVNYAL